MQYEIRTQKKRKEKRKKKTKKINSTRVNLTKESSLQTVFLRLEHFIL